MLVLTRKIGQRVFIGDDIIVTVTRIDKDKDAVSLGFDAPKTVAVHREEVLRRIQKEGEKKVQKEDTATP
jgi:carbon storage regulator